MFRATTALIIGLVVSVSAFGAERVYKFDKNQDNRVSYVELADKCKVSKHLFELADKNGDGVLSEAELRTAKDYLLGSCQLEEKNS